MADFHDWLCLSAFGLPGPPAADENVAVTGRSVCLNTLRPRPNPSCATSSTACSYVLVHLHPRQTSDCPSPSSSPFGALSMDPEHDRMRDNNWSPPPTADSTTPFNQADPSLLIPNRREFDAEYPAWHSPSPSTTSFQYTDKSQSSSRSIHTKLADLGLEPRPSKPLLRGFERPSWAHIAILTVLCLVAYPALYMLTLVARDKSLFTVRLLVAMWCSGIGFTLGYVLLRIGAQHLEAASESTLIRYRDFLRLYFK